jgi:5-methylcytosine-specific restriction endonuclease McrA
MGKTMASTATPKVKKIRRNPTMEVLLLNNTEEVLNIIPWHRAVKLINNGKAMAPHGHHEYYTIGTGNGHFELPTAIVLLDYVNIPYRAASLSRRNIMKRDEYTCQYCRKHLKDDDQTLDHVLPTSRRGKHEWMNVVACCRACNAKKADRTPDEAGMKLIKPPSVPSKRVLAVKVIARKGADSSWSRWLGA